MAASGCPRCQIPIEAPGDRVESLAVHAGCPGCGRPLAWFAREDGGHWILDEEAEGRRRMAEGPGAIDPSASI